MEAVSLAPVVAAAEKSQPRDLRRNRLQDAFSSCCDGLHRYILVRVGGRRDVADDILQQTCCVAAGKQHLPNREDCEAWLFGIARNLVRRHWRRERVRGRTLPLLDAEQGVALLDAMESAPLPAEVLESDEAATGLRLLFSGTPSRRHRR